LPGVPLLVGIPAPSASADYGEKYAAFPPEMSLTAFTDVTIIAQALDRAVEPTRRGLTDALAVGTFDCWRGPISFERRADHWNHSPSTLQLLQYKKIRQSLGEAAVIYPPELMIEKAARI
jgi:ABC-type branched-subunit amino acid transport system substrate-binding protein